jgi:hypothetical protein
MKLETTLEDRRAHEFLQKGCVVFRVFWLIKGLTMKFFVRFPNRRDFIEVCSTLIYIAPFFIL